EGTPGVSASRHCADQDQQQYRDQRIENVHTIPDSANHLAQAKAAPAFAQPNFRELLTATHVIVERHERESIDPFAKCYLVWFRCELAQYGFQQENEPHRLARGEILHRTDADDSVQCGCDVVLVHVSLQLLE